MSVAGLEIDLVDYTGAKDFHVFTEFKDTRAFTIVVQRLDVGEKEEGWTEDLSVFLVYPNQTTETRKIGPSPTTAIKRVEVSSECALEEGPTATVLEAWVHSDPSLYQPQRLSRAMFSKVFDADLRALPHNLFALGIRKNRVYLYNETYECLFMIELTLRHIVHTVFKFKMFQQVYFVIAAHDGYLEHHYLSHRTIARSVGDTEFKNANTVSVREDEYPVFHGKKWILAQSTHRNTPFCADMPDRYYFCLNHYNLYRSIHRGIPFERKIPKIVYASHPRGTKYNFVSRRDIECSQRAYFYSSRVPKTNVFAPASITREEQIQYKYVLDIDGNSSTWDATAWKLNAGSVLMKTAGPWRQWFYDAFLPWTHYVPIKDDFSDLDEKFAWCESHLEECKQMIVACKRLFQDVYHYPNILKYSVATLFKVHDLTPIELEGQRLFLFQSSRSTVQLEGIPAIQTPNRMRSIQETCRMVAPNDLLMFVNSSLCDFNAFETTDFVRRYQSLGKKVVFGAERNLWPESLSRFRDRFDSMATNPFRYLQADLIIGTAGEFQRIFDEQIYDPDMPCIDQEYFAHAWVSGKFDIGIDSFQTLALMTFRCSHDEIDAHRTVHRTPLILWNGGRF